jgi:hypothetical protein
MAGLVPAIHAFIETLEKDVDGRDKRGHDDGGGSERIHLIGSCTVTSFVPSGNVASI